MINSLAKPVVLKLFDSKAPESNTISELGPLG